MPPTEPLDLIQVTGQQSLRVAPTFKWEVTTSHQPPSSVTLLQRDFRRQADQELVAPSDTRAQTKFEVQKSYRRARALGIHSVLGHLDPAFRSCPGNLV